MHTVITLHAHTYHIPCTQLSHSMQTVIIFHAHSYHIPCNSYHAMQQLSHSPHTVITFHVQIYHIPCNSYHTPCTQLSHSMRTYDSLSSMKIFTETPIDAFLSKQSQHSQVFKRNNGANVSTKCIVQRKVTEDLVIGRRS